MKAQFTITKDHIADPNAKQGTNANAVGIVGPNNATLTHEQIKTHPNRRHFKMYDDDKEIYYEGYLVGDADGQDGFLPLDCFGMPNAGATSIHYRNPNGSYSQL